MSIRKQRKEGRREYGYSCPKCGSFKDTRDLKRCPWPQKPQEEQNEEDTLAYFEYSVPRVLKWLEDNKDKHARSPFMKNALQAYQRGGCATITKEALTHHTSIDWPYNLALSSQRTYTSLLRKLLTFIEDACPNRLDREAQFEVLRVVKKPRSLPKSEPTKEREEQQVLDELGYVLTLLEGPLNARTVTDVRVRLGAVYRKLHSRREEKKSVELVQFPSPWRNTG